MPPEPSTRSSCLYAGTVVHRRVAPVRHEFRYRVSMIGLDLAEAASLDGLAPLWGCERRAPVSWWRRDHFGDPGVPLDVSVRDLVAERTGARPLGSIRLLTTPRVFGYGFNPISLFFCHDEAGAVECIVAEVTNTPWLERHCYVLPVPQAHRGRRVQHFVTPKEMHVSPFLGMRQDYRWRFAFGEDRLRVGIAANVDGTRPFFAGVSLVRSPLHRRSLLRCMIEPPFGALGTAAAIHFEALRLWWKGAPYHSHPHYAGAASLQTGRCPHAEGEHHDDRACAA